MQARDAVNQSHWSSRRERDKYTRAISLVISRGFGVHVKLTLWWWSISWHRRDRDLERRLICAAIDVLVAERLNRDRAHSDGALDV